MSELGFTFERRQMLDSSSGEVVKIVKVMDDGTAFLATHDELRLWSALQEAEHLLYKAGEIIVNEKELSAKLKEECGDLRRQLQEKRKERWAAEPNQE